MLLTLLEIHAEFSTVPYYITCLCRSTNNELINFDASGMPSS